MFKALFASGLASLLAMGLSSAGCSSIEHAYDCNQICSRYAECFDSGYDTDSCETKCKDHSSDDDDFGDHAESCQSCIGDKSCASATFNCADDCSGIVP